MADNYQQKDNSGALFVNDKKLSDNHPDFRGKCMVNGKEMQMSAWKRTSQSGNTYMSFAFSEPYNPNGQQQAPQGVSQPHSGQQTGNMTPMQGGAHQGQNQQFQQEGNGGFGGFDNQEMDPF